MILRFEYNPVHGILAKAQYPSCFPNPNPISGTRKGLHYFIIRYT
ncbi:MAG TPA: hypothetical protein VJ111_06340 [Chitinophagaceae bacterium]|nr:hypothetical protein [Chitinophagaceae bacterium]